MHAPERRLKQCIRIKPKNAFAEIKAGMSDKKSLSAHPL
jgi:hypothetical protein